MNLPVLYSFRRCPYAIRGRMALAKAGIQWEHREVSLKNKPPEMLALSAKGTVPVLVLPDGTVIDESLDVMLWALDSNDPDDWLQGDTQTTLQLIYQNDFEFKPKLDKYKYHVRHPEFSQQEYRQQADPFLSLLNSQLNNNDGGGLVIDTPTLADVAIFPFVRQFAGVDRKWFDSSEFGRLAKWLAEWEKNVNFLDVMQKYDVWHKPEI